MVNTAKRELRWHVDADWIHARGMAKEHPDDQKSRHRRSRPQNPRQFEERWTAECCVRKGRLYYKPQLMPRGYDGDGSSGVNNGNGNDGDEGSVSPPWRLPSRCPRRPTARWTGEHRTALEVVRRAGALCVKTPRRKVPWEAELEFRGRLNSATAAGRVVPYPAAKRASHTPSHGYRERSTIQSKAVHGQCPAALLASPPARPCAAVVSVRYASQPQTQLTMIILVHRRPVSKY